MQKGGSQLSPLFLFLHTLIDSPRAYGILPSNLQKTRSTVDSCYLKKVDMTAAPKDAPTEIHCSEGHTGSSGMTLPEGTCPHRTSLARCFLFDMAEKVKHRRPQVRFSRETVRAARVTSGHCSTHCVREQNLRKCTIIPHARNTSRGTTQDSKRRGQRGSRGPPHWLVSAANVAAIFTGFLPANSSSVLGLVLLSFAPFRGCFPASLRTLSPVQWTSPQCTRSGKCESQSFGFIRSNSLLRRMHPCRWIFQPSTSFTVVTRTAAATGVLNLFPNRSPLPSGREIVSVITRARRPCCLHADM